jgi:dihydropteroate synthase
MQFCCRSHRFELDNRVLVMGVLNVTPDSFSDGGVHVDPDRAVAGAMAMLEAGADIVDIGGESTRPGAAPVSELEEIARVQPVVCGLRKRTDAAISIDTWKAGVALAALTAGADIINDISGFNRDPDMAGTAARHDAGCVIMHMRGTPQTMQTLTNYVSLIDEINAYFTVAIDRLTSAGVAPDHICLDPGIGFSKTAEQNLALIRRLSEFESHGLPILLGASRKSFIGKTLEIDDPSERVWGTAAAVAIGVANGAGIVRVHDVAAMRQVADLAHAITK